VKVAAYQSPIAYGSVAGALPALRAQIDRCEAMGVEVLCCAEGVLGGLADYVDDPARIAIRVSDGSLAALLAPLASETVTAIIGFTELGDDGGLYNSAAIWSRGAVTGVYRKRNPAINRSVYRAGHEYPVFSVGALTFGVMICRDSVFPEVADALVSRGAQALFVPTNNGMPEQKGGAELPEEARCYDISHARVHGVPVIRADVVGEYESLISYGATGIVSHRGEVVAEPPFGQEGLIVADIAIA
jgi:5-aminopentanamidase